MLGYAPKGEKPVIRMVAKRGLIKRPATVRNYFQRPNVSYAADAISILNITNAILPELKKTEIRETPCIRLIKP